MSALFLTHVSAWVGPLLGLTDTPDTRKRHSGIVPLTGGVAVFLAIAYGCLALGVVPYTYPMLVIASSVLLLGVIDDIGHINPWLRLVIQYACGLALATYGGIAIHNVGNLLAFGNIPLFVLSVPLSALAVAGLTNAYNMIDGIDGLAASTASIPLLALFGLAVYQGHPNTEFLLLMLAPLAVFLLFNLGPGTRLLPKVFLGDSGSLSIGFLVTASLVYFSQGNDALILPVTALWLVTVPLMDMLATMLRRAKHGRKLMQADRSHLHHLLMDMGFSARQTLALLTGYGATCALIGLALEGTPEYVSFACYLLLFLGHCVFVLISASAGRRRRRSQLHTSHPMSQHS